MAADHVSENDPLLAQLIRAPDRAPYSPVSVSTFSGERNVQLRAKASSVPNKYAKCSLQWN